MSRPIVWVGLDPGTDGGIAAVGEAGEFLGAWDMPVAQTGAKSRSKEGGRKAEVDPGALARALLELRLARGNAEGPALLVAWLERVSAMPGQGVSSMFTFGGAFRAAHAVPEAIAAVAPAAFAARPEPALESGRAHVAFATPQEWRRTFGLPPGADKPAYHALALSLWIDAAPALHGPRKGPKYDRSAALLIAEHGRRLDLPGLDSLRAAGVSSRR